MLDRLIEDIVLEDFANAKRLYSEGIPFYKVESSTLSEVCSQYALNHVKVKKKLTQVQTINIPLNDAPIEDVLGYLVDSHRVFIKERLPYFSNFIENIRVSKFTNKQLAKDLQFIFPVFVEDFIHHILEEEKTLFSYINKLIEANFNSKLISSAYAEMESKNISSFALEHLHDDPMKGIRKLTNCYTVSDHASIHEKVIMYELKRFDQDLSIHAKIEDQLLFSKALVLEQKLRRTIQKTARLN